MFHMRIWGALAAFAALVAVACMAGCSRSDLDGEIPEKDLPAVEKPVGVAYIRLHMNLSGGGIPAGTRAEGAEGSGGTEGTVADSLSGSENENKVNRLDLLVFDAESDLLRQIISVEGEQLTKKNNVYVSNPVPVYAGKKQKLHIYVAANLPDNMRERLSPGLSSNCAFTWTQNDYWSLMNEILPGSDGKQKKLQSSGIPMTGQLATKEGGSVDIEFTEANMSESTPLKVTANLSRMVAKVHVVAEAKGYETTSDGLVDYVNAKDVDAASTTPVDPAAPAEDYSNWIGWIRLDNVRYMLNGVNKSTYLFPQPTGSTDEYPLLQDCNMNLDSYVVGGQFDPAMRDRDYCFLQRSELHDKNVNAPDRLAEAEAYDAERLKGETGHYVEGMYCLENYFNRPQQNTEVFDRYEGKTGSGIIPGENADVIPMVTHVYVAAKLTPRYILVTADYKDKMQDELVNDFKTLSDEAFSTKYGVEKGVDFTQDDVNRWDALMAWDNGEGKKYGGPYFTGDAALYRNTFRIVKAATEQQAADIIKWSLIANKLWNGNTTGIEDGKCPPDTFYVYDTNFDSVHILESQWNQRYLYLTAGAVAAATGSNMRIKIYSVPHLGGWGYYYTYINQTGETYLDKENKPVPGRAPYTASQVTRNTYYVLTINNFGGPGGTITSPEFIKVNTEPIDWCYGGKGDIDLY